MESSALELRGVSKYRWENGGSGRKTVLQGIDATVPVGSLITIMGPSGAGKSTLLGLLNRLEEPDEGEVLYRGKRLQEWQVLELRRRVGLVFQNPVMFDGTVEENILYGPKLRHEVLDTDPMKLLEQMGLPGEMLWRQARELSGGEQQRVALARTMANRPEVLLLDEVTSSLDPESALAIEQLVVNLNQEGVTVLWVTHDLVQARRLNGSSWILVGGRLVDVAPTSELFAGRCSQLTRDFLQGKLRVNGRHYHE